MNYRLELILFFNYTLHGDTPGVPSLYTAQSSSGGISTIHIDSRLQWYEDIGDTVESRAVSGLYAVTI